MLDNLIKRICRRFCGCSDFIPIPVIRVALTPAERATYAKQLIVNPVWEELFENLQDEAFKLWANSTSRDFESREFMWQQYQIVSLLKRRIAGYLANAALDEDIENKRQKNPQPQRNLRDGK